MAMIQCDQHGVQPAAHVCRHLKVEPGLAFVTVHETLFDDISIPHRFCATCAEEFGFQDGETFPDLSAHEEIVTLMCSECFQTRQSS